MNLEKFTERSRGFLQAAQTIAMRESHQRVLPDHLLKALMDDEQGLASNLILTRLLFPEAFGLMALGSVVLVGLQMFSDAGIGPSIAQSPRGDDPEFLDTAWTAQVLRGVILWLGTLG